MNSQIKCVELVLADATKDSVIDLRRAGTRTATNEPFVTTTNSNYKYSRLSLNSPDITGVENEDFYHSKCCLFLLCNQLNVAKYLSHTFHSRKAIVAIILLLFIYGLCLVIQQLTEGPWPDYCNFTTYYILEIIRSWILDLLLLLGILSFNTTIFKQQCFEFETIYKLYSCCVIVFFVAVWDCSGKIAYAYHRCMPYVAFQELNYVVSITFGVIFVACIDAWRVPVYAKLLALFVNVGGIVYYYYYFAVNYAVRGLQEVKT